jgi:hypothetical protein
MRNWLRRVRRYWCNHRWIDEVDNRLMCERCGVVCDAAMLRDFDAILRSEGKGGLL